MSDFLNIATWNVNSINMRGEQLLDLLDSDEAPEIICLQELKLEEHKFFYERVEELGFNIAISSQKSYNGVAILSKYKFDEIIFELKDNPDVAQKRYLEAVITINLKVYRIICVYVPNGQDLLSDKFIYKLKFLEALYNRSQEILKYDEHIAICGDINIAPFAIDVFNDEELKNTICCSLDERAYFRKFIFNGYADSYRMLYPDVQEFTWWDYRAGAWQKNFGLRIDHILLSANLANTITETKVLKDFRAKQKPSDHAPVVSKFKL
jgi:exodeoxyribonuclease-3